jgi:polyisoprenoid-binding protein YceI
VNHGFVTVRRNPVLSTKQQSIIVERTHKPMNITHERTADVKTWSLDPVHSSVEFSVQHLMISRVRGRFRTFSGSVWIDEEAPHLSGVEAAIDAASIDTGDTRRDDHLRSQEFLDVARSGSISFRSTRIDGDASEGWRLTGDLTIRGTVREVTLDLLEAGGGKDPWGGIRRGFTATGVIDRRDFGLNWNQTLEAGGILVGNQVKITIDAQVVQT